MVLLERSGPARRVYCLARRRSRHSDHRPRKPNDKPQPRKRIESYGTAVSKPPLESVTKSRSRAPFTDRTLIPSCRVRWWCVVAGSNPPAESPATRRGSSPPYSNSSTGGITRQPQGTAEPVAGPDTVVATISEPQRGHSGNDADSRSDSSGLPFTPTAKPLQSALLLVDSDASALRDVYIPPECMQSWL